MNLWRVALAALVLLAVAGRVSSRRAIAGPAEHGVRVPHQLAGTGLYAGGRVGAIDARNRPFAPQYPLWSDGAAKSRWVYLPPGATIDVSDPYSWQFPVGTRFWKEFAFNGRRVETRLLWKATAADWITVSYAWNADQTDATLVPEEGLADVADVEGGRRHSIPSVSDCGACHGGRQIRPLGFTALQLSTDRDPGAIHAEALTDRMVTLKTLIDERLISPVRADWLQNPPRIAASDPHTRTVLGYLSANCGSCHNGQGEIAVLGPVLDPRTLLTDADAVAAGLLGQPTRWQVPGVPDGSSVLVNPQDIDTSAILVRMRSRRPSSQMPPLGTVLRDQAAVDSIAAWIAARGSRNGH